jgi:hypothetical protein
MAMVIVGVGRVAVAFHDEQNPTDAEWNAWISLYTALHAAHGDETRALVRTLGGAPNAAQRASLGNALGRKGQPSAVLTSSTLTRGVVTAISWLGIPVRAFKPDSWVEIREYLELDAIESRDAQAALARITPANAPARVAAR